MYAYATKSIAELIKIVNGYQLESEWQRMGRILKILGVRMKRDKYKELLSNIDVSDRTAFYLVAIVTRIDNQMIKVPEDIGWRKLAEVAPVMTYANSLIIFEKIRKHTREELIEMKKNGTLMKKKEDNNGT